MILNMNDALTLMHLSKPFQDALLIIDAASTENELLLDMPSIACNKGQIHEVIWYDNVPKGTLLGYNMGIKPNNTQILQKTEGLALLASACTVDKRMADDSGDKNALINFESRAHIEGMGRQQAYISMYGDKGKNPLSIDGLATRTRRRKAATFVDVADKLGYTAGTNVTSLYMAALGPKLLHFLFNPAFGKSGVKKEDNGAQRITHGDGGFSYIYELVFSMEWGIAAEHPDCLWCLGNIDRNAILTGGDEMRAKFIDLVLHHQKLLPKGGATNALYGNLDVIEMIEKIARDKEVVVHVDTDPWGKPVDMINGMRLRRMDVIPTDASEKVA
ncbi:MAG: hypothetical protein Ta2B_09260 [Termitinemataceae bacterium]|nr:MAG: hypothetical protein Ta2B_09260 [Termitinemataceae bacterium]